MVLSPLPKPKQKKRSVFETPALSTFGAGNNDEQVGTGISSPTIVPLFSDNYQLSGKRKYTEAQLQDVPPLFTTGEGGIVLPLRCSRSPSIYSLPLAAERNFDEIDEATHHKFQCVAELASIDPSFHEDLKCEGVGEEDELLGEWLISSEQDVFGLSESYETPIQPWTEPD